MAEINLNDLLQRAIDDIEFWDGLVENTAATLQANNLNLSNEDMNTLSEGLQNAVAVKNFERYKIIKTFEDPKQLHSRGFWGSPPINQQILNDEFNGTINRLK